MFYDSLYLAGPHG